MKIQFLRLVYWGAMVLTVVGELYAAEVNPANFTVVQSTGKGITFTVEGRTFGLKPGDAIPKGAIANVPAGASMVVSPATGTFLAVNSNSKVGFVANDTMTTSRGSSSQILVDVISGKVAVNTGSFLSPGSRVAVNTPQGIVAANNAAFAVSTVTTVKNGVETTVGGVEVNSGKVNVTLPTGEQLGVTAGKNLVTSNTAGNVTRAVTDGLMPASLVGVVPGETQLLPGDSIVGIGNTSRGAPDSFAIQSLAQAVAPSVQESLNTVVQASIPPALVSINTPAEKVIPLGTAIGIGVPPGTPISAVAASFLNKATSITVATSLATAGSFQAPKIPNDESDPSNPTNKGPGSTSVIQQLFEDISNQLNQNDPTITNKTPPLDPGSSGTTGTTLTQPPGLPLPLQLVPTFLSGNSATGTVGQPFPAYTFQTSDPTAVITIISSTLPTGLTISGETISGTPTESGSNFTVTASAYNVIGSSGPFTLNITINPAQVLPSPTVAITASSLSQTTGVSYTYAITITSGTSPYTISSYILTPTVTGTWFPADLSTSFSASPPADAATSTSTPTSYILMVTATDANNLSGTASITISVVSSGTPTITAANGQTVEYISPTAYSDLTGRVYQVSPELPYAPTTFDSTVTTLGNGGLYWPWTNQTLAKTLIQAGLRPSGDVFAAYYVYTHYDTSGNYYASASSIPTGQNATTVGTYSGPGQGTLTGLTLNF